MLKYKKIFFLVVLFSLIVITSVALFNRFAVQPFDGQEYLHKIWVVDDWDGAAYEYPFSICITSINNRNVSGIIKIGAVAMPDCYSYRLAPSAGQGTFSGTISANIAQCSFSTNVGDVGDLKIIFDGRKKIEASITIREKPSIHQKYTDSTYYLRPYNLSDIHIFSKSPDYTLECAFPRWGMIRLIGKEVDTKRTTHPVVFLIDKDDNILYDLGYFLNGTEIVNIQAKDINGDGLVDISILSQMKSEEYEGLERKFIQLENGLFCRSELWKTERQRQKDKGDGFSVLTKPEKGDDIPSNSEMSK